MKQLNKKLFSAIVLAALILAVFPVTALAASPKDVVIGNSYTLGTGQTLNTDLFVVGGSVNLMEGSTINGNVLLIGGSAQAAGTINGNLTVLGGSVTLTDTFKLSGNLNYAGTVLNQAPGAKISGSVNTTTNAPYFVFPSGARIPMFENTVTPVYRLGSYFLGVIVWALFAMLVAMFLPTHLNRASETALSQPLLSGGLGILTIIIGPIIIALLTITICLIPVAFIVTMVLIAAWAFGLIALGLEIGKRISLAVKRDWHPAFAAGLGTLVLMAILNGLDGIIPCVGWIPKILVSLVGLGAVLLTQFGRKPYVRSLTVPPASSGDVLPPAV